MYKNPLNQLRQRVFLTEKARDDEVKRVQRLYRKRRKQERQNKKRSR